MCGIFGVFGHPEAANITYLGLHALQHRGQESAGIVSATDREGVLQAHRAMGLVQAGFSPEDLARLPGEHAIGHVRYATAGAKDLHNAQPLSMEYRHGALAVAHNGNLTNSGALRRQLERRGSIFQTSSDTEAIVHLIAISQETSLEDRIVDALRQVEGAYSLLFMDDERLVAVRDPAGFRPLLLGVLPPQGSHQGGNKKRAYVVSSEPSSFDLIGAERLRDIEPGEMVVIDTTGIKSRRPFEERPRRMCIFEYVYFARPDAHIGGVDVYAVRKALGGRLVEEHPVHGASADDSVVIPVPDSGVPAAIGLAHRARLPFEMGLIRSHYVGRTFIEPSQSIRHFGVRLKLNPNAAALKDKRVIVVDDSIVRGTTSRKLVKMLRGAGAREVHVRISSPPTVWPCFYGIDTPTRSELIAASHSVEEICRYLGADSLGYLSLDGLVDTVHREEQRAVGDDEEPPRRDAYCHACFSGEYPVPVGTANRPRQLRLVRT
ncbi:MAG: amidophosphoribosyltransferase [Myxococcota bacterium]